MAEMIQTLSAYEIRKLSHGGYVVGEGIRGDGTFYREPFIFASTGIAEALEFVRQKLEANPPK